MANNTNNMCLLGAMDRLWFHQIILLSQPNTNTNTNNIITSINNSVSQDQDINVEEESTIWSPSLSATSSIEDDDRKDEDLATDFSVTTDEPDSPPKSPEKSLRSRFSGLTNSRNRSHSSLSSSTTDWKLRRFSRLRPRLEKSMSCRSFGELELEEVKGFLDLGFTFNKEQLNPRMMSLIPGLQRLDSFNRSNKEEEDNNNNNEEEEDEEKRGLNIKRPYLSEAWLIRKPSSPLLNLKVPKGDQTASEMKKHLRFWARTVASEIQQES